MKYILFLMFFTTPPTDNKSAPKIWTLQSTSTMEYKSATACKLVGDSITESIAKTDTLTVRGWCFCESEGSNNCSKSAKSRTFSINPQDGSGDVGIMKLTPPKSE